MGYEWYLSILQDIKAQNRVHMLIKIPTRFIDKNCADWKYNVLYWQIGMHRYLCGDL